MLCGCMGESLHARVGSVNVSVVWVFLHERAGSVNVCGV